MKRVELLIDMARKLSKNTRYDSDSGVPQDVFVQYFNNAQDSLLKEVVNLKTKYLLKQLDVDVVPGQTRYDYPDDCYMQHIDTIQWFDTRNPTYYQTLYKSYPKERVTNQTGYPFGYVMHRDGVYMNPPINNGILQFTYIHKPDRLQKRGGLISVATQGGGSLTALTVNPAEASFDETEINAQNYLCVVGKDGAVKARNIPYDSCSALGVFTLSPFAIPSGESVAVGDYIVVGPNSTNIPEWDDICESYLIKHAVYEAKYSDGSAWSQEAKDDMARSFASLSGSFSTLSDDITQIPITNLDFIGY